jgi:hypothetical protein
MNFSFTSNVIQLEKKISIENYPKIIIQNDKETITESDIRIKLLNRSWFNIDNYSLKDFLTLIIDEKYSFCPSTFQSTTKLNGFITNFEYSIRLRDNDKYDIISKSISKYNDEFPKEIHVWRSKNGFKSCQVLMIDIDEGYDSLSQIYETIVSSSLKDCSFIYKTFSYNKELGKIKVRIGWVLDEPITNIDELEMYLSFLINEFKADKSCSYASRFYFPGMELVHINENIVFNKEQFNFYSSDLNVTTKKILKLKNNEDIIDEYDLKCNCANKQEFLDILKNQLFYNIQDNKIVNFKWKENIETQWEFTNFKTTHLKYKELFSFALNLNIINGGLKWLKEQMDLNNQLGISHYDETDNKIFYFIKKYDYVPMSLSFFERCKNDKTFYIDKIETDEIQIDLEECDRQHKENFNNIIEAKEPGVYISKAPTGSGKTEILCNADLTGYIIANFTHDLKDEFATRIKNKDNYITTPKRPIFEDKELNHRLNYYDECGTGDYSSKYMKHYITLPNSNQNDVKAIKLYQYQYYEAFISTKNVLTTHHTALFMNSENHHTIIFDEDPFDTLFKTYNLSGRDLQILYNNDKFKGIVQYIIDLVKSNPKQHYYKYKIDFDIELIEKELKSNRIYSSNIIEFFKSDLFVFLPNNDNIEEEIFKHGIIYDTLKYFPKNMKIVILSATVNFEFYEIIYGKENVHCYEVKNVKLTGEVIQDTRYKVSKHSLELNDSPTLKYLHNTVDLTLPTITYKDAKHYFPNSVPEMHFGNTIGYDSLNGKDSNVIGNFSRSSWYYVLLYNRLYPNIPINTYNFGKRRVEFNGFRFTYITFENPLLQRLHLNDINTNLVQAIGRGRALRKPIKCYVYGGFPIKGSTFIYKSGK